MEPVDAATIRKFLTRLGEVQDGAAELVLLGGSGLLLLGNPRTTADIDYVGDDLRPGPFQHVIDQVAAELHLVVDPVPIQHFVPLPPDSDSRRVPVARFGHVDVYVIDPYVTALSKLDRGFDSDIADIVFLVDRGLVEPDRLAAFVESALLHAGAYDLDPGAMQRHLRVVLRRAGKA